MKLSSGNTPIVKASHRGCTWNLALKGILNTKKPLSQEQQIANFMQTIAETVYYNIQEEKKPEIFCAWIGRFCTVPLKTNMQIKQNPHVLGCDPLILASALLMQTPKLPFFFIGFFLEFNPENFTITGYLNMLVINILNKMMFCIFQAQDNCWFAIAMALCGKMLQFIVGNHSSIVRSTKFNIQFSPKLLLCLVMSLTFADPIFLGRDPTITFTKWLNSRTETITVNWIIYEVIHHKKCVYVTGQYIPYIWAVFKYMLVIPDA